MAQEISEWAASIDDDERPGNPTEIGDAMIDDIRHAVQEDGRITVRDTSESFDLTISTIHTIVTEKLKLERKVYDGYRDCWKKTI